MQTFPPTTVYRITLLRSIQKLALETAPPTTVYRITLLRFIQKLALDTFPPRQLSTESHAWDSSKNLHWKQPPHNSWDLSKNLHWTHSPHNCLQNHTLEIHPKLSHSITQHLTASQGKRQKARTLSVTSLVKNIEKFGILMEAARKCRKIGRNEENWIQKAESRKLGVYFTNSKMIEEATIYARFVVVWCGLLQIWYAVQKRNKVMD